MDIDKIYDIVNDYLERKLDALLYFVDAHRLPLIVTFSVHLAMVIIICNVALSYIDVSTPNMVAISMEDMALIEKELSQIGSDRHKIDTRLSHRASMSGFTNHAAADLGEDIDISQMSKNFSTLREAEAITHQVNEYGENVKVDLFSEQVKNREIDLDEYQRIDTSRKDKKPQVYVGKSSVHYSFTSPVRHNIAPLPVPIYTARQGGLVVVDVRISREGKVIAAQINTTRTTCPYEDAHEKALVYARRARFNVDATAPESQQGYISYEFQ